MSAIRFEFKDGEHSEKNLIIKEIEEWINLSPQSIRLRCGEMTWNEIRTVRAVLNSIIQNIKMPH
jgi:hypothetical protein